eukprot:2653-Amorphochlora_amoeboformis.AAC.1
MLATRRILRALIVPRQVLSVRGRKTHLMPNAPDWLQRQECGDTEEGSTMDADGVNSDAAGSVRRGRVLMQPEL